MHRHRMHAFRICIINALAVAFLCGTSASSSAQHSLQLDDGAGHYSLIQAAPGGSVNTYQLPQENGILLTSGSLGTYAWLRGGNAGVGSTNQIGTLDATDLQFVTSGISNIRMKITAAGLVSIGTADGFTVNNNGDLTAINAIAYSWPGAQAASPGMVLTNNGAGALSWAADGSTITPTINSDHTGANALSTATTNDLSVDLSGTYFRISATLPATITGMSSTGVANGRMLILVNVGANNITLTHEDAASLAANRFDLPGASDIILGTRGTATFIYDGVDIRWRLVATN